MLQLRFCAIEWTESGARTCFPGGLETSAWPHPEEPHYHVISHRCGYGDRLIGYCREHELAHAVVAEELLGRASCVLEAMAHKREPEQGPALLEEIAAQALQRWVRANERPILAGCDWDRLRASFLRYVARLERELAGR